MICIESRVLVKYGKIGKVRRIEEEKDESTLLFCPGARNTADWYNLCPSPYRGPLRPDQGFRSGLSDR